MSDQPSVGRRRAPRGALKGMPRVQSSTQITLVTKRATKNELRQFRRLWINQTHTEVIATTQDEALAKRWKHYRSYLRDSQAGTWEYEVTFGEASVSNAQEVLR